MSARRGSWAGASRTTESGPGRSVSKELFYPHSIPSNVLNVKIDPIQVSLRQYKNGQFRHKCGAALLTREWVITAAHCVKDISPSNLLVRVGEYNVLDTSEAHSHVNRKVVQKVTLWYLGLRTVLSRVFPILNYRRQ